MSKNIIVVGILISNFIINTIVMKKTFHASDLYVHPVHCRLGSNYCFGG